MRTPPRVEERLTQEGASRNPPARERRFRDGAGAPPQPAEGPGTGAPPQPAEGSQPRGLRQGARTGTWALGLVVLLAASVVVAVTIGPVGLSPADVWASILAHLGIGEPTLSPVVEEGRQARHEAR